MIQQDVIEKIAGKVQESTLDGTITGILRRIWPDIHFTFCSEDDVHQAKPVYESNEYFLYLVDNSNHCISFTSSFDAATGVVIAECEEE